MESSSVSRSSSVVSATEVSPLLVRTSSQSDEEEENSPRAKLLDELLDKAGYGLFHVILVLVAGWALASDSVEVQCISFVAPVLEEDTSSIKPSPLQQGALDSIIFLGMMVGGYLWGAWSDLVGRRTCLIISLSVNWLFGLASSLSPDFASFLFFRFGSGVG